MDNLWCYNKENTTHVVEPLFLEPGGQRFINFLDGSVWEQEKIGKLKARK